MIIEVLVCGPDGTQHLEQREVPDDYLNVPEPEATPDYTAFMAGLMEGYAND